MDIPSWTSCFQVSGQVDLLEKEEACVIVANHQSSIDVLAMFLLWGRLGRVTSLAKQSLLYTGTFGGSPCLGRYPPSSGLTTSL